MRTVVLCKCVSLVYDFKNREYSKDLRTPRYFSQNSHKLLFIFTEVPLYHQLHASHIGLQFFENMIQCFYKLFQYQNPITLLIYFPFLKKKENKYITRLVEYCHQLQKIA